MRNRNLEGVISGALSGVVILVVFLLGRNLIISIAAGVIVFVIAAIIFKKDKTVVELVADETVEAEHKRYTEDLRAKESKIKTQKQKITDSMVIDEIDQILKCLNAILREAEKSQNDTKILRDLATFYMPSFEKVHDQYIYFITGEMSLQKMKNFEKDYKEFLPSFRKGIKKQYEAMLSDDILDAQVEMDMIKGIFNEGIINEISGGSDDE